MGKAILPGGAKESEIIKALGQLSIDLTDNPSCSRADGSKGNAGDSSETGQKGFNPSERCGIRVGRAPDP